MYGLGVYFANDAEKCDAFVSDVHWKKNHRVGRKILLCEVKLGKAFVIDTSLNTKDQYHDCIKAPEGFDSIHVFGQGTSQKPAGLSVNRDEYIIFNPRQAYPRYEITYDYI